MKSFLISALLLFICTSASAAVKTQVIEYYQGNDAFEGYLAYDDQFIGKRPGVLVVHEWKGLNDYAKMRADMLAKLGYIAFAADIYGKGVRPQTVADAVAESSKYKNDRSLLRARAQLALDVLKTQNAVNPDKIAAIGYCFGGTTVLELARSGADLKGVVSFHGGLSTPTPDDARNIKGLVLALHGADDPFVPPAEVAAFEQEMKAANVSYQLIKYPGAVHGFTNPANQDDPKGALYNAKADKASWKQMRDFLRRILN